MKLEHGYSLFEVKSFDEDKRVLTGIATTPSPDRMDDVVEPKGAQYNLPIPFLWQHDHSKPIGHVTQAKVTDKGIEVSVQLAAVEEAGPLKDLLDMAWQSIKSGLVRGLSIGFKAVESANIDGSWGRRFLKWDWLELSAVTVPANAEASITAIKSIDQQSRGVTQESLEADARVPGVSGKPSPKKGVSYAKTKEKHMNIAEQIKALEDTRAQKMKSLNAVTEKAVNEGRTKDQAEQEEFDTLAGEIKSIDAELKDLRQLEALNGTKAVDGSSSKAASESRSPAVVKNTEKLEPGILFTRYVMCKALAKGDSARAFQIAKNAIPQNEVVCNTLKFEAESAHSLASIMKANVNAGTTLDTTWAAPLVDYQNFAGDFVEFLRPQTIIGQFGTNGRPSLNRIPFNVRIAGQTSGGNGYWVGEGAPKPLTKFDFNATELRWAKVAAISVLTEELIRFSNPSAEALVRQGLVDALRERLDIDFVNPDKAAVANISPASITNGIAGITSSGPTAANIRTDLKALWAPFIAANNPPTTAVYIMSATTALALSLMQNDLDNAPLFPGLTMNGGTLNGVPVIVSEYLDNSAGSGGSIVILVNARDIWLADDGQFTVDASREASLQMDDAPTNNSATGTETSLVSMFQTNSVALRGERYINWARRRSSAVSWLDGVNWGAGQ